MKHTTEVCLRKCVDNLSLASCAIAKVIHGNRLSKTDVDWYISSCECYRQCLSYGNNFFVLPSIVAGRKINFGQWTKQKLLLKGFNEWNKFVVCVGTFHRRGNIASIFKCLERQQVLYTQFTNLIKSAKFAFFAIIDALYSTFLVHSVYLIITLRCRNQYISNNLIFYVYYYMIKISVASSCSIPYTRSFLNIRNYFKCKWFFQIIRYEIIIITITICYVYFIYLLIEYGTGVRLKA